MKEQRNLHRKYYSVICVCVAFVMLTISANAYTTFGYKLKGSWYDDYYYISARSVTYNNRTVNYGNITDDAIDEWNAAINVTSTSDLDIELTETDDGDASTTRVVVDPIERGATGWRGFTYYYSYNVLTGKWSSINYGGYPNKDYNAGSAVINLDAVHTDSSWKIQNTIMHEIGHIFGLKHSTVSGALMVESTTVLSALTPPQSDDINGVRAVYD